MTEYREPDEQLSENFWLYEFLQSVTADEHGITIQIELESETDFNLRSLVATLLQPLRYRVGHAIKIASGYRPSEVNRLVGGAENSQHASAEAADIYSAHMSIFDLARVIIRASLPYDQMIVEYDEGVVHISRTKAGQNRREALSRWRDPDTGEFVYRVGVVRPDQVPAQ